VTPYEVLGVSPLASPAELTTAYRTLAQIFHPDRFVESPEPVRREAERRMKQLNQAYALARKDTRTPSQKVQAARAREARRRAQGRATGQRPSAASTPQGRTAQEQERAARAAREREARVAAARAAREQEARSTVYGDARPEYKLRKPRPRQVMGLGQALKINQISCKSCKSVLRLAPGWKEQLAEMDFFCSVCGRLVLSR
jgi:molecular chaperone DnaJ